MDGMRVLVPFHVPGTLAANVSFIFRAPCDLTLKSVQAVGTNANNALITVGTTADTDGYLTSSDVGDSSVPAEYRRSSFTGALVASSGQDVAVADDTVVQVTVDYDGSAGTAVQNLTVLLEFTEG
jgi:hypothetical protein